MFPFTMIFIFKPIRQKHFLEKREKKSNQAKGAVISKDNIARIPRIPSIYLLKSYYDYSFNYKSDVCYKSIEDNREINKEPLSLRTHNDKSQFLVLEKHHNKFT